MQKYLILAVLVGALVAFTGWQGYKQGKKIERLIWAEAMAKQAAENLETLNQLHLQARAQESLAAVLLQTSSDNLREVQNAINDKDSTINKQYRNIKRLRFALDTSKTRISELSAVTARTVKCDGREITELSGELFEALYQDFGRCDAIVNQLTACQEVVKIDRQICNKQ